MTFDPNEARDKHGQWTVGNSGVLGQHAEGPAMAVTNPSNAAHADMIATRAAAVAKKLGFDPSKIKVTDGDHPFQLNGKAHQAAGVAYIYPQGVEPKGTITMFANHNTPANVDGVVAHEIQHQKFQAFLDDADADYERMKSDPDYLKENTWVPYSADNPRHAELLKAGSALTTPDEKGEQKIREPGFMRTDGLLNEPYASHYPAYQAKEETLRRRDASVVQYGSDGKAVPGGLAAKDGVSDYSAEYWKNFLDWQFNNKPVPEGERGVTAELATHETLAEIARLKYQDKNRGDSSIRNLPEHRRLGQDLEGNHVYFRTGKSGGRVAPVWSKLYNAVEENWKRRNKK